MFYLMLISFTACLKVMPYKPYLEKITSQYFLLTIQCNTVAIYCYGKKMGDLYELRYPYKAMLLKTLSVEKN